MRRIPPCFGLLLLAAGCATPTTAPVAIDFSRDVVNRPPATFTQALAGDGRPPAWVVRDSVEGRLLMQESTDETINRFPLCVYDGFAARNVAAEVRFRAIDGVIDQAGGVMLRYRPDNYYLARVNDLSGSVSLLKVVDGRRIKIVEAPVALKRNRWHSLSFIAQGSHLSVALDGTIVIETDDATFGDAGKVGLWTKSDTVGAFDDLKIKALR